MKKVILGYIVSKINSFLVLILFSDKRVSLGFDDSEEFFFRLFEN